MQSHPEPVNWGKARVRRQHSGQIASNNAVAIITVLIGIVLVIIVAISMVNNYFQSTNTKAEAGQITVIRNSSQREYMTVISDENGIAVRIFRQDSLATTELLKFKDEDEFNNAFEHLGVTIDTHQGGGNTLSHAGWSRDFTPSIITPHDTLTLKNKESGEEYTLRYFYATGILVNTTEVDAFDFNGREAYYGIVVKPMPDQSDAFLVVFNERWEIVPPQVVNE